MIPEELKTLRRWHNWRDVDGTKIPIQVNGNAAKSNDPTTWTDFETADAFGMLAFELGDGYAGVDLDNCLDVFGELRSWAWKIVDRFDGVAYMEISPSVSRHQVYHARGEACGESLRPQNWRR
jgi:putative DNA primase/helicase